MAGPKAGAVELTAKRTARAKHFRNPDGSFSAVISNGPVHYRATPGGPWLDKNLTFAAGGTRTAEQRSPQSDVSMATWQTGSGAARRWWVEFVETLSGKGIRFQLSFQPNPVLGTNELQFTGADGVWSYFHTRTGGKMLGPSIATAQGLRTFGPFPYVLVGGADQLAPNPDGSLQSGSVFYLPAPHVNGADGMRYAQTSWQLDTINQTVSFTINDAGLPPSAFPYMVDPSTTFSVAASGDDDTASVGGSVGYPPTGAVTRFITLTIFQAGRYRYTTADNLYYIRNGFLRFDASGSGVPGYAVPTGATVRLYLSAKGGNPDGRSVVGEFYAWDGTDSDYAQDAPTTGLCLSATAASITAGQTNDFALTDLSGINLSGTTPFRLHVSGGAPTGENWLNFVSFDDATLQEPRLLVDYLVSPVFRAATSAGTPTAGATSLVINAPAGLTQGDEMEAALAVSGGTGATVTPPAGWGLVGPSPTDSTTVVGLRVYRKTAEAGEPANYTWTFDTTRAAAGGIAAYYNTSPTSPIDDAAAQANASSATVTAPTITTHSDEEQLIFVGASNSASTWTAPGGMTERLEAAGYGPGTPGAAKNFYLLDSLSGATQFYTSQEDGSAPADAAHSTATGWIPATNAAGQSALLDSLTEIARNATDWSATLQPSAAPSSTRGDAWSTPSPMRGQFASGNWTLSASVRSVTAAYTGRFRFRWRVWASVNQNGSGARELTGSTQVTAATTANLSTSANTTLSVTWSPGATITLDDEYLFFQLGIEVTTAGTGTTTDVNLRKNSASAITTPAWTPAISTAITLADEYRGTAGSTGTRAATASVAAVNIGHALSLYPRTLDAGLVLMPTQGTLAPY